MRTIVAMLFPAVILTAAQACSAPKNEARIAWTPLPDEQVRAICLWHYDYAGGCVKKDRTGCTIITPPMPMQEFTGMNHDMTSSLWRELAHEVMHCLGYEHEPTPK